LRPPSVPPGSALGSAAYRLMMAGAAVPLRRRRDNASRAVASALRTTALGRIPREERAWIDRIEAHRSELASGGILAAARSEPDPRDLAERQAEAARACRWMSLPPVLGRLLLRLVRELAPRSCLELGTGFGISTAYQTAALELNEAGGLISLDVGEITRLAQPGLSRLGLGGRVELVPGRIEETLGPARTRAAPIDFALLDADHTEEGTVAAFDAIAPDLSSRAIVVCDDINWTDGMRRAWRTIGGHRRVSATVGLRRLGIAIVADAE
jgi:predicted O-methyltransferase YrrM